MPKVYLSKLDRQQAHFSAWLYGNMKITNTSQEALAKRLGVSQQALSRKLKTGHFSYGDLLTLFDVFKPEPDEMYRLFGIRKPTGSE